MLKRLIARLKTRLAKIDRIDGRLERIQEALGRIEAGQMPAHAGMQLRDFEFRVHSQWGEDGIIQHLIKQVAMATPVFVEFGVQDYTESNTRFLLTHNNWSGLVMDSSPANIESIRHSDLYWRYNLKAECAFISKENINDLLSVYGLTGEIGLLSIDIDGNDYWVWDAISVVTPAIVVVEYNSRFGPQRAVTIPYDPGFDRGRAHYSMIYYGASLKALKNLGTRKGYALVGCNSAGNNAFFVRRDRLSGNIREIAVDAAFVQGKFREARDRQGNLQFLSFEEEAEILQNLPLIVVDE